MLFLGMYVNWKLLLADKNIYIYIYICGCTLLEIMNYIFKTYDEYYTNVYQGTTIENKLEKQHN